MSKSSGLRGGATGRGGSRLGTSEFGHVGQDRAVRLQAEEVARRGPSGMFGIVTPPSEEAARRSIEAGICPMCGQGPYKVVSVHTNKKHGVDKYELRDMAGMSMSEPTCLPEFSAGARERGKARADSDGMRALAMSQDRSRPRRQTKAGAQRQVENLTSWIERNPSVIAQLRAEFRDRMTTPEAMAKWERSMDKVRSERVYTEEERKQFAELMARDDIAERRAAARESKRTPTCTIDGCEREHLAKGLCKSHYRRRVAS